MAHFLTASSAGGRGIRARVLDQQHQDPPPATVRKSLPPAHDRRGALRYPVVVLSIAVTIVTALMVFVMPQLKSIHNSMNIELTAVQKLAFTASDLLQDWWFLIVLVCAFGAAVLHGLLRSAPGRCAGELVGLRLPVIGPLLRAVADAHFTRTMGTALAGGVPLLDALDLTASESGSPSLMRAVRAARPGIREGDSIALALTGCPVLTPALVELISEGEGRDNLPSLLLDTTRFYDAEVDRAVVQLTAVIEPLVIVFMGLVIGAIIMSGVMPIVGVKVIYNVG